MGNSCFRSEVAAKSRVLPKKAQNRKRNTEKESLLGDFDDVNSRKQVKIKITKRQLEEILGNAHVHDITVDQLLTRLIITTDFENDTLYQRSWRPVLQTIPEVN